MEATKKFKGHLDRLVIDLMNKISKLSIKLTDSQSVEEMIVTSFKISDYSQRLSFLNKFRSGCEESMYYESDEVFFKEFLVSYTQQVLTFIINLISIVHCSNCGLPPRFYKPTNEGLVRFYHIAH